MDIAVVSDLHLGTFGSRTQAILQYLGSIDPKILVLNGDIIDAWQLKRKHFGPQTLQVLQKILDFALSGTRVYYLTGNHDEFLRRFALLRMDHLHIDNELVLEDRGKKMWFFHGDIFDTSVTSYKWLAKAGGKGYDALIWLNYMINKGLVFFGQPRRSLSKKIKESIKSAVKYISDFEKIAAELAITQGYDTVICGHIHVPQKRTIHCPGKGSVLYLNSGDWVENLSALEYIDGHWSIYKHEEQNALQEIECLINETAGLQSIMELDPAAVVSFDDY